MKLNKKGFTIVELVIVIAVIAILAAVLIPTFSSVTKKARESAAYQQAKSGMDSILALTEGSLADGTIFAVTDKDTNEVAYKFLYANNSLAQTDVDKAIEYYDKTTVTVGEGEAQVNVDKYIYAIYVSAQCWSSSTTDQDAMAAAEKAKQQTQALILSVLKNEAAYSNATAATLSATKVAGKDYYTLEVTGAQEGTQHEFRVYYNSDVQPTMVTFIGHND